MDETVIPTAAYADLAENASNSCDNLINQCISYHSKVEVLRRAAFRLDDLMFSIKSCCIHLRDHKLSSDTWSERIDVCFRDGKDCDVMPRINDFNLLSTDAFNLLNNRVRELPSSDALSKSLKMIDNAVLLLEDTVNMFEHDNADIEIVEKFNGMLQAKHDVENTLDSLQGINRSGHNSRSSSRQIDVVDVENWNPDNNLNHSSSSGYNQPGKRRNTRNSSNGGDLRDFLRKDLDGVQAQDGEGDHNSDSDYDDNKKDKKKRGVKGGAAAGAVSGKKSLANVEKLAGRGGKVGRPTTKKTAAPATANTIKSSGAPIKKKQNPFQGNNLGGFIANESDVEREVEADRRRASSRQRNKKKRRHSGQDDIEDDDEEDDDDEGEEGEDGSIGVDNGSGGSEEVSDVELARVMAQSKVEQRQRQQQQYQAKEEEEEEDIFPYFSKEIVRSTESQIKLEVKYGKNGMAKNTSSSSSAVANSQFRGRSATRQPTASHHVVDLSMDLTQASTSSSFIPSPTSTPPQTHSSSAAAAAAAAALSLDAPSPSRRTRAMDQNLAAYDEALERERAAAAERHASHHGRSRSNSNVSNASSTAAAATAAFTVVKAGTGASSGGGNKRAKTPPLARKYYSQDDEFEENHIAVTTSSTSNTSTTVKLVNVPWLASSPDRPTQSSGSSHISPIPVNRLQSGLGAGRVSDSVRQGIAKTASEEYWDLNGETDEDGSNLVILGDTTDDHNNHHPVILSDHSASSAIYNVPVFEGTPASRASNFVSAGSGTGAKKDTSAPASSSFVGLFGFIASGVHSIGNALNINKKRPRTPTSTLPPSTSGDSGVALGSRSSEREARASKRACKTKEEELLEEEELRAEIERIEAVHSAKASGNTESHSSSSSSSSSGTYQLRGSGVVSKPVVVDVRYSSTVAAVLTANNQAVGMDRQDSIEDPDSDDEAEKNVKVKTGSGSNSNGVASSSSRGIGTANRQSFSGALKLVPRQASPPLNSGSGSRGSGTRGIGSAAERMNDSRGGVTRRTGGEGGNTASSSGGVIRSGRQQIKKVIDLSEE